MLRSKPYYPSALPAREPAGTPNATLCRYSHTAPYQPTITNLTCTFRPQRTALPGLPPPPRLRGACGCRQRACPRGPGRTLRRRGHRAGVLVACAEAEGHPLALRSEVRKRGERVPCNFNQSSPARICWGHDELLSPAKVTLSVGLGSRQLSLRTPASQNKNATTTMVADRPRRGLQYPYGCMAPLLACPNILHL